MWPFGESKKDKQIRELKEEVSHLQFLAYSYARTIKRIADAAGVLLLTPITGDPGPWYAISLLEEVDLERVVKDLHESVFKQAELLREAQRKQEEAADNNGDSYKQQLEDAYAVIDDMVKERGFTTLYQMGLRCPSNFPGLLRVLIHSLQREKEEACDKLRAEINGLDNEIEELNPELEKWIEIPENIKDPMGHEGDLLELDEEEPEEGIEDNKPDCNCPEMYVCPRCRAYKLRGRNDN